MIIFNEANIRMYLRSLTQCLYCGLECCRPCHRGGDTYFLLELSPIDSTQRRSHGRTGGYICLRGPNWKGFTGHQTE